VRLILATRKLKTKIKWTTRTTTKLKVTTTNSSPTTIRRTNRRGRRKVARLRRASAKRANVKKMAMSRVRKKAQSISTTKQALSPMRSSMNHLKLKAKAGKSPKITSLWLKAQNPRSTVNLKMTASSSRKMEKMILHKMKMVSRTTSTKLCLKMNRFKPLRQIKISQTKQI
jgi:hypothetical protein